MFFLIPLGHEQMEARRWPIVTLAIIALCALLLTWQLVTERQLEAERLVLATEVSRVLEEHPNGAVPESLRRVLELRTTTPGSEEPVAELVELEARARVLAEAAPAQRLGFHSGSAWWALVTSAFLHTGFLHFLGNAWFLWLSGASVEDRWGRGIYGAFYLLAAAAGGLTHHLFGNGPDIPLIGASGAVAGAMGAFMVLHGGAKIRFAYLLFVSLKPRSGTFEARAYGMLLLWLGTELLSALLGLGDGTAHFAHVGGFVFGAAVAFGFKRSGLDHRLDAAVEQESSLWQDRRVIEAGKFAADRRYPEAFALLDQAARDLPSSIDVQLEMLRLAQETQDRPRELSAYQHLIENYLQSNMLEQALEFLEEARRRELQLPRPARFGIAEVLARRGQREEARRLYESLLGAAAEDELGVRAAIAFATLSARSGHEEDARRHLELAALSPHRTPELAQRIEAQLAALGAK